MQMSFILLVCIALPKLVYIIFDILGKGITLNNHSAQPYVHQIALLFALVVGAFQIYGTGWGWKRLKTAHTAIKIETLPTAFKNYKIVQISDLHVGTYADDTTYLKALVDSVNKQQPDLIVFTGDLVNTKSDEAVPFINILRELKAKDGILSILGNHDYCIYQPGLTPKQLEKEVSNVIAHEREAGWNVLLNDNYKIVRNTDTLWIAGVENVGKPPFPEKGNLQKALKGIPQDACILLLSHDPWHWRHGVLQEQRIALTLSGHTHAMQLQIGNFSPASWFNTEWGGLYREGKSQLFVSTGIGGTIPYRLGAWPRIEVLTLH